ncbi:MAG: type II toxin-antitoxin system antitoxin VapB [Bacillota bacterium]
MDIAKIFNNGRSQAVRLPKEYRFSESEVYIKKIGDAVMLIPKGSEWKLFEHGIREFSEDYMLERKQPDMQERDNI